ncbi:MAG: winged helix-turn-helix transcriptional regulator [Candidatus Marinimicrobia bacterium]|mgnify:FL=1|jgi:DNA-binding transcriptional ArsR family regulator|nr:winged helix-turn-helix transcriptional regulator [Candidatus Neomarinimicrobiota bacterium]OQC47299.1 MAG: Transcriptional repressor SdpR [Candidatus Marinimicrobia bacterium ADurb.Bin030]MBP9005642.1 winged helix-turn-helix transcriptional regulator [Candidatus Neomarinimicrobiota bacterium]HNZ36372.1 autorepressor SdpR family transcription factor [Candidatus Neomarinimicrobiota bacterium]HOG75695.1 autorepressor SdpR family transcription factor [Candidatus Neomarinimicrobiota bacterium]
MNTVYRALSDPTRRQILKLLREKDLTAGEIAEHFTMTKPSLSKHFNILRSAGLIQGEKSGVTITYHLNVSVLEEAIMALMEIFKLKGENNGRQSE